MDSWERRYHAALERFELDQADWSRLELALRRLAGRLARAAAGHDAQLDALLDELSERLRAPLPEDALTTLTQRLGNAVTRMDLPPAPVTPMTATAATPALTPPTGTGNEAIGALLLRLLDRLQLQPALAARAQRLHDVLATASDRETLTQQAEALADLVNAQRELLLEERQRIEGLLQLVGTQIDQFAHDLVGARENADSAQAARERLDTDMQAEMHTLGEQVGRAIELESLQHLVRSRLRAIAGHLGEFRQREQAREQSYAERLQRQRDRIEELENQTRDLLQSLRAEQENAATDPLTGLPNRLAYDQRVNELCSRHRRFGQPASLLVMDLDHFKCINDSLGHAAGDRVLRVVAAQLRQALRETDLVARYGGEEFAALLEGSAGDSALAVAEKIRARIETLGFHAQQRPVPITLSIGIADLRADDTAASLFARADAALYAAKHAGRNRIHYAR